MCFAVACGIYRLFHSSTSEIGMRSEREPDQGGSDFGRPIRLPTDISGLILG